MRGALALAVLLVLSAATPASAALQAPATDSPAIGALDGFNTEGPVAVASTPSDANATSTEPSTDGPVVRETVTLNRTPAVEERLTVTLNYTIPANVSTVTVETPLTAFADVRVADLDGFERRDDETFAWNGETRTPSVVLRYYVDDDFGARSFGVERRDWAFAYLPRPEVTVGDDESKPEATVERTRRVASAGHATVAFGLDGAVATSTRRAGDANLTVVVAPGARPRTELDEFVSLYRFGGRELAVGERYDDTAVFVLPDTVFVRGSPAGTTVNRSVWLQDRYSDDDDVESIPAHEYVHTRLGSFGDDESLWLTEATAEYYGYLFSLNRDNGDWDAFREALSVDRQRVRESTLTERYTWASGFVPYQKGARVLAALDAEIRLRTDGERTLQDVLAYRYEEPYGELKTYENFSGAVVAVTEDPAMQDWLARYVDGDEVPPLPGEPDRFVLNDSIDSDGDGLPNGEEVETNPFDADTDDDGVPDDEDAAPTDGLPDDAESPSETGTASTTATTTTTELTTGPDGTDASTATERTGAGTPTLSRAESDRTTDADGASGPAPGFGFGAVVAVLALAMALAARRGDA